MSANSGDTTVVQRAAYVPGGRTVAAERGWSWIAEGWRMFLRAPGLWIGMILMLAVIFVALNFVPLVGPFATIVLQPVFAAGLMIVCAKIDKGEAPEFGDLFAGFQKRFGILAAVGAIYLAGFIAILVAAAFATGVGAFSIASVGTLTPEMATTLLLALLIVTALMLPLAMAVWFAAPLVLFQEQGAVDAMKASFSGCLRNIMPFLVYGVIGFLFAILASVPAMLGWLVLGPVAAASVYTSYRDIYLS